MAENYKEWITIAQSDLLSAKIIAEDARILPAISIYHSHQCVEKLLKALLLKNNQPLPKVHNLNYLLNESARFFPELKDFENDCTTLNEYQPKLRYPYGDTITKNEAINCIYVAEKVSNLILTLLN